VRRTAIRRGGRGPLSKERLLPLSTERVRALSLEYHLALATVRAGRADFEQIVSLLRVVYLAFYLREETASGADRFLYRRAEAAMEACIERAERREKWLLHDHERAAMECLLVVHDEQLAAVSTHRYLAGLDRLQRFMAGTDRSPITEEQAT
jgi:hypothetical protein